MEDQPHINIIPDVDLLPAYGFGITDSEESRRVETLLYQNPKLNRELRIYQRLAELFLYSVPLIEPPPQLKQQLIAGATGTV